MEIVYRNIEIEDAEQYLNLINKIKDEEIYLFNSLRFPIESTKDFIKTHKKNNCPVIGAFTEKSELVGWINYSKGSFDEISHIATIGMGVSKEYRNEKIGSALMERCIIEAGKIGVEKLELEVFSTNISAIKLYKRYGFKTEGILIKKRKFKGKYEDLICMGLFLQDCN